MSDLTDGWYNDILFIFLWVGGWGLLEISIDVVSNKRLWMRIFLYLVCFITAGLLLWLL
jgi:hypothetical protein